MTSRSSFTETSENGKQPEVKAFIHQFSHPDEHKEFMEMMKLGSTFDMRPRAMMHFYGSDLIAYKRKHRSNPQVNEFLRIFSTYLTTYLEDECPESWEECSLAFWEELIIGCFPKYMKIHTKQRETKIFLMQLKRFVHWLDERTGGTWFSVVEKFVEDYRPEIEKSERMFNELYLHVYPKLNDKDWNPGKDVDQILKNLDGCSSTRNSVFELTNISDTIVSFYDLDRRETYQLIDFPAEKDSLNFLVQGVIGKRADDFFWRLYLIDSIYPNKLKRYIKFLK